MKGKNYRSIGFTLVELLVVISIIALLLAMLMPALNKAREQAIRIVCASNMKSTGTSMAMYITDNKGTLPPDIMPPRAEGKDQDDLTTVFWQQKLVAYTKNGKVFTCSNYEKYYSRGMVAQNFSKSDLYGETNRKRNWYNWYCSGTGPSFGYNHRALGCGGWYPTAFGCYDRQSVSTLSTEAGMKLPYLQVKQSNIKNASNIILCLDNVSSETVPPSMVRPITEWRKLYHPKQFLHNGGVNLLYVDCHAEWKKLDSPSLGVDSSGQADSSWGNCNQDPSF